MASLVCPFYQPAKLDKAVSSLDWLLGNWESVEPGKGSYPSLKDFRYTEDLHFAQMGQPIINFMFNASDAETKKILHRECGFIRMQTGTNRVAFIIAQNSGLVEVEEGELVGKKLSLHTQALARPSFAKEPHVKEVSRVFQLQPDGKLEQTLSMSTDKQPMTQHLHVTYSRLA
ncbi:peroxynitrite isomerase THAP4-like [Gadus chalcogrammus]|uniref:peroxynitrite isomerase THAP4-like n=1 Tax=Gadus chalcogrammus TaxID=1042646 RepID=UPI0024C4B74B|nr:peroxynitrite isomerase THAP4-like [Gadus chalcogrammus]